MHSINAATSKVENSAQGLSCKLKFVHTEEYFQNKNFTRKKEIQLFSHKGYYWKICFSTLNRFDR